MHIFPAFAVPMVSLQWPDADRFNPALKTLLLSRETETHRNPVTSMDIEPGLYESKFELFSWTDPPVLALRQFCWDALYSVIGSLNRYSIDALRQIDIRSHTWFHITRRGGQFGNHNHPMASWSGVYCVAPGRHDADRPNSGVLRFINPLAMAQMFRDPANQQLMEPFQHGNLSMRLDAGQLVLFPSWVFHEVAQFHGSDERITIAFNCWFERRRSDQ